MDSKITHLTINTGHCRVIAPAEVAAETVDILRPWVSTAIAAGTLALPVAELSHFSAVAFAVGQGLLMTINAPASPHIIGRPHAGRTMPMLTIGIAGNTVDANTIWDAMCRANQGAAVLDQPPLPWVAVILYPTLPMYRGDVAWMGDFERCLAVDVLTSA